MVGLLVFRGRGLLQKYLVLSTFLLLMIWDMPYPPGALKLPDSNENSRFASSKDRMGLDGS